MWAGLGRADESAQANTPEFSDKFRKGGSFSIEPALWLPMGSLDKVLSNTLGYNVNFDIGVSPDISVIFGGGYYDQKGQANPDYNLLVAPFWAGIKSKNQFLPMAEVYWEADAALYYEKAYLVQSSTGSQENLDGGGILGAGFDIWWTRWLTTGFDAKFHLVVDDGEVFPFAQLGIRVGIRG
jgi:hypothetical protein